MNTELIETLFKGLCSLPREAVYCLVNDSSKRIQIYSTSNLVAHLSRLTQEVGNYNNKELLKDLENLEFRILETEFPHEDSRSLKFKQLVEKYKKLGYEFYNDLNVASYRLKESFQYRDYKPYYVVGSKGTKSILIGVFSKYREARSFQAQYYPEGTIPKIVVAENEETKGWVEKNRE